MPLAGLAAKARDRDILPTFLGKEVARESVHVPTPPRQGNRAVQERVAASTWTGLRVEKGDEQFNVIPFQDHLQAFGLMRYYNLSIGLLADEELPILPIDHTPRTEEVLVACGGLPPTPSINLEAAPLAGPLLIPSSVPREPFFGEPSRAFSDAYDSQTRVGVVS